MAVRTPLCSLNVLERSVKIDTIVNMIFITQREQMSGLKSLLIQCENKAKYKVDSRYKRINLELCKME